MEKGKGKIKETQTNSFFHSFSHSFILSYFQSIYPGYQATLCGQVVQDALLREPGVHANVARTLLSKSEELLLQRPHQRAFVETSTASPG